MRIACPCNTCSTDPAPSGSSWNRWARVHRQCRRPAAVNWVRQPTQATVHAQVTVWAENRNIAQTGIDWQLRIADVSGNYIL